MLVMATHHVALGLSLVHLPHLQSKEKDRAFFVGLLNQLVLIKHLEGAPSGSVG